MNWQIFVKILLLGMKILGEIFISQSRKTEGLEDMELN